ncbi:lysozyme-like [Ylistrum balloti]|uniref:lysozyme-like n=1 Tax=Ylistrum balloti TaxID=509963 RepID=UPI002905987A|nr:lysozyme-like [Ylistrum balloti]
MDLVAIVLWTIICLITPQGSFSASVSGSCLCLNYDGVHARTGAGLSHSIVATLNHGECYVPSGDVLTHDGYHWHELKDVHGHHRVWVAGDFLQSSSASHCISSAGSHFNSSSSGTHHTYTTGIVSQHCLDCICHQSSGCKPARCEWEVFAPACGYFQLMEGYWRDCGMPGGSLDACAFDLKCSSKCVQQYMSRYISHNGCPHNCESYARIHAGGPAGCTHSSTLHYWREIEQLGCSAYS